MILKRTTLAVLALVLIVGGGVIGVVPRWRQNVARRQDEAARGRVSDLLAKGRGAEALALVRLQPCPFRNPEWAALEVRAMTDARDAQALDGLYQRDPGALAQNENAALLLLRGWLAGRYDSHFAQLRKAWRGRERSLERWTFLDADALLWAGQREAAATLLRSQSFRGAPEAARLMRLALAADPKDRGAAWAYLSEARAADPRNADIRSFCAQFLEAAGRLPDARVDYVAAVLADPKNPLRHDQLAEFYRRQGSLDLAVQTWRDALNVAPLDFIWVKTLFWSRVVQPPPGALPASTPGGALAPLVARMRETPPGQFWAAAVMSPVPGGTVRDRPEAVWLEVLEQVRAGREAEALKLLEYGLAPEQDLQPDLSAAFRQILFFRSRGVMPAWKIFGAPRSAGAARHSFFDELEKMRQASQPTAGQAAFLKGPHALAAACLAAGWRGAALSLWAEKPLPPDVPEWYVYALAQSLRYHRGPDAALSLVATVPSTPLLEVLAAELLLQKGSPDEGCARLAPWVSRPDDIGDRAAWLVAVTRLEQGRLEEVRAVLSRQPRLARGVTGREIEARLALAEGDADKAEALYRALARDSVEARAWLARRAAQRQDWAEARRLTLELLTLMPEEMALRQSLVAIDAAAQTKK